MRLFGFGKKKSKDKKTTVPKYDLSTFMPVSLDGTRICKNSVLQFAEIKDGDRIIPLREAIERFYADPKVYFPWEFHVNDVRLEKTDRGFDVLGDGVKLGEIRKNGIEGSDYYYISQLYDMDKIDRLGVEIKTGSKYFALNEEQYKAMVKSDPHGQGTQPWMERDPKVTLKVYFDPKIFDLEVHHIDFGDD